MARKRILPTSQELELLTFNPFVNESFVIQIHKRISPNTLKRDEQGDFVPMEMEHEVEQPTKIYGNYAEMRQRIGRLKNGAKALLLWIYHELEPSKDYVVINRQRFMAENLYKTDTGLKEGILDLSRYQFITPTVINDVYWINPRMMFRGSRANKYPQNKVKQSPATKKIAGQASKIAKLGAKAE